jgi:hypothetical protein
VRNVVEAELGRPLDAVFGSFETVPMAAASIAVVHRAHLVDGTPVAVKVLRPGIEATVAADLTTMQSLLRFLARQGVPLLRITKQENHVVALAEFASLAMCWARTMVSVHSWSFRAPDPAQAVRDMQHAAEAALSIKV